MLSTIVVPVDDSPTCERALPVAAALARRTGATVELLTVDPLGVDPGWAEHRLRELASDIAADVVVTTTVVPTTGTVVDALAGLDRGSDAVVCLAPHARGAMATTIVGSVADGLVRRSSQPVLLVGPGSVAPGEGSRPVLAAIDGSSRDGGVVSAAARWARATDARLEIVHVVTRPSAPEAWAEADAALADAEDVARAEGTNATTSLVAATDPGEGLIRAAAAGAGCVVLGSHRRTSVGRLVLGSTVTALVRRAPCPVLVAGAPALVGAAPRPGAEDAAGT